MTSTLRDARDQYHPVASTAELDAIADGMVRRAIRRQRLAAPKSIAVVCISFMTLLALWQAVVFVLQPPTYALPSPHEVYEALVGQLPLLAQHAVPTLTEILVGFAITVGVFVPLGVIIAQWRLVEGLVNPLLVISQTTPMIAIAPLLITWLGFGLTPKIVMVVLISFFPVVINTVVGFRSVAPEIIDMGRSMGASQLSMLLRVRLPGALPSIFAGLRVAMTLAVVGAVVGEFAGADTGLGYLIVSANGRLNTALVFATVITLAVMGLILYKVVEFAEWLATPWRREKAGRRRCDLLRR